MVPVQHYSRKPAAGPSCDQCWTDSNDHPATGQGLCGGFTLRHYSFVMSSHNTNVALNAVCNGGEMQRHVLSAAGRDKKFVS